MPVAFSAAERAEYHGLESTAREFYQEVRGQDGTHISAHSSHLFQKLLHLRVACVGGAYAVEPAMECDGEALFVFQSKFKTLISPGTHDVSSVFNFVLHTTGYVGK